MWTLRNVAVFCGLANIIVGGALLLQGNSLSILLISLGAGSVYMARRSRSNPSRGIGAPPKNLG